MTQPSATNDPAAAPDPTVAPEPGSSEQQPFALRGAAEPPSTPQPVSPAEPPSAPEPPGYPTTSYTVPSYTVPSYTVPSDPYTGGYDTPPAYPTANVPAPVSYPPPAPGYAYAQPQYPYVNPAMQAYDPMTGQDQSDKSRVIAGLLQLLLGFFFALGGVGRLYAGNTSLGVVQLCASVVGWMAFWCGILANIFVLFLPLVLYFGIWLWFIIDGIVLLAKGGVDGNGRVLRS
jgi:hypothetical protein